MKHYRVQFLRTTSVQLHLDVEAESVSDALHKANELTQESDDLLVEEPETYGFICEPTGAITEVEEGVEEP